MIILDPSLTLPPSDFRIHEAGHYVVGVGLGIEMAMPEIYRDGSGGIAPFERLKHTEDTRSLDELFIEANLADSALIAIAAGNIAAVYLAGYAAEAIMANVSTGNPIGAQSNDFINACRVLELGRADTNLGIVAAWRTAVVALKCAWSHVEAIAALIPVTGGTHRPPIFH